MLLMLFTLLLCSLFFSAAYIAARALRLILPPCHTPFFAAAAADVYAMLRFSPGLPCCRLLAPFVRMAVVATMPEGYYAFSLRYADGFSFSCRLIIITYAFDAY